ncbi:hypothetical protein DBR39_19570 [Chryseobacterium sp. KBW03]|uniref:hypothetical protein n=1 Tax=Chryseobacterium sp. KBW03 TaxID=2153362 RepID=UPI000F5A05CB|nr:hypothetical protein [Chryseobacterium sp. KBW03]RQO35163.1 hypothetical protein DBR39_19570 [Chryseobacterium sp. KBW03]
MDSIFNKSNFGSCITEHNDIEIYIKDINNSSCEISSKIDFDVVIENKKGEKISFLKIDKCVYQDGDGQGRKCDLSINNSEKVYFIEIKSIKKENLQKALKTNDRKDDALDQLIQTINKFKNRFPTISLRNVNAVIALKPNINIYSQPIQTAEQVRINQLLTSCGTPNLYLGNKIII